MISSIAWWRMKKKNVSWLLSGSIESHNVQRDQRRVNPNKSLKNPRERKPFDRKNNQRFSKDFRNDNSRNTERKSNFSKENRTCYKCGTPGHLAPNCRTPQHLIDAYKFIQSRQNGSRKVNIIDAPPITASSVQANFMENNSSVSETYSTFDASIILHDSNCLIDSATTNYS